MLLISFLTSARSTGCLSLADDDDDEDDVDDVVVVVVVVVVVAAFFPARLLFPFAFAFSFAFFFVLDTRTPMATTVVPARMLSAHISCRKTQRARPQARPLPREFFFLTLYIQNIKLQRWM
jgi:hypothetical protein